MKQKVMIIDADEIVRIGLTDLLSKSDHEVVFHTNSVADIILQVAKFSPNLIIADHVNDPFTILPALQKVKIISPNIKIIIFSYSESRYHYLYSKCIGMDFYISKKINLNSVLEFISLIEVCSVVQKDTVKDDHPEISRNINNLLKLTQRELCVLSEYGKGKSNHTISAQLGIHRKTVSSHKTKIMKKLKAKNNKNMLDIVNHVLDF